MWLAKIFGRTVLCLGLTLAINSLAFADISRPGRDMGSPTKVEVEIFLIDIDDVDGASQSFDANVYYELRWSDPRLVKEDRSERRLPLYDIWHPRVQLINQKNVVKSFPEIVEITPSGEVIYRQRMYGSFSQPLELQEFPFDQQVFEIQLGAVGYNSKQVQLVVGSDNRVSKLFSLPDWNIINWKVESRSVQPFHGSDNMVGIIAFSVKATRRAGYYIGKVIIPLFLILAMSWVVFWIDPRETGPQISVAITSMLTLIAYRFSIGTNLPKVEYMTRLDLFILASSILVFASLIQVVTTSSFAKSDRIMLARKIDISCRWLFPVIFILIVLGTLVL